MRNGMVECKECRFWLQFVNEVQKHTPRLLDIGLCLQVHSVHWFSHTHGDDYCEHGELNKK